MKTLTKNFLSIDKQYSSLDAAGIAIVSAPYEHTVSYGGGTKAGPKAIIDASAYVEFYDEETDRELCFDVGIATMKPIAFGKAVDRKALALIQRDVEHLLDLGRFVVTLGGEHTISSAPIAAHYKKYPKMSVLQFDAHSDLRDEYEGSPYSHASVMARVCEFMSPRRVTQVGIRALCKEEREFIRTNKVNTFFASALHSGEHGSNWAKKVVETLSDEVYITFDVDALDPSIMPSTGTPEPDGLTYQEAIQVVREVVRSGRRIVGLDVVELAPVKGLTHPDLTTARLVYKILNLAHSEKRKPRTKKTSTTNARRTR